MAPTYWTLFWALLGLGLLGIEMLTLSFFFMFFGVSALVVAAVRLAGLNSDVAVDLLLFSMVGSIGLLAFRKRVRQALSKSSPAFEADNNTVIQLTESLPPHGEGRIQYQGTAWTAVNEDSTELVAGTKVRIEKVQGIKLHVKRHV